MPFAEEFNAFANALPEIGSAVGGTIAAKRKREEAKAKADAQAKAESEAIDRLYGLMVGPGTDQERLEAYPGEFNPLKDFSTAGVPKTTAIQEVRRMSEADRADFEQDYVLPLLRQYIKEGESSLSPEQFTTLSAFYPSFKRKEPKRWTPTEILTSPKQWESETGGNFNEWYASYLEQQQEIGEARRKQPEEEPPPPPLNPDQMLRAAERHIEGRLKRLKEKEGRYTLIDKGEYKKLPENERARDEENDRYFRINMDVEDQIAALEELLDDPAQLAAYGRQLLQALEQQDTPGANQPSGQGDELPPDLQTELEIRRAIKAQGGQ